jgi:integrase
VFCNPDGTPWPPDTLTKQFVGLARLVGAHGFRLHDLRRGFASVAVSNGANVKEISLLLGSRAPMLTLSTCARSMEGVGEPRWSR